MKNNSYPLSAAQMRVWLDQQINPSTLFYNISHLYEIKGRLDIDVFHQSILKIISRHEILRSIFFEQDGEPIQQVLPSANLQLPVITFDEIEGGQDELSYIIDQELKKPFNLGTECPIRTTLIQTNLDTYLFILVIHHIASDQWSTNIIYRELSIIYNALIDRQEPELPSLPIQYKDFAMWEKNPENPEPLADQEFWQDQFKGDIPILDLPFDKPRPQKQTFHGRIEQISLNAELWGDIKSLCDKLNVTPFMLLVSAYGIFLNKLTGQKDILVGTFLANRQRKELTPLIGILFNNLPLRLNIDENQNFSQLTKLVRDHLLDVFEHMNYSFDDLVHKLKVPRIGNRLMLYNTSFQMYYQRDKNALNLNGLNVTRKRIVDDVLYDLMGYVQEKDKTLQLWFNYNSDVFEAATIRRLLGYFCTLLRNVSQYPNIPISKLEILSSIEKLELIEKFNDTFVSYPRDKSIPEIILNQVNKNPDKLAITEYNKPEKSLSYNELNFRANQLANYLLKKEFKHGQVIGILLKRSIELFVTYLAVLKIGGICLVIDEDLPRERIRYMMKDSNTVLVITSGDNNNRNYINNTLAQVNINWEEIWLESGNIPSIDISGESSAAIIYTSGSSGRPKGVELLHRGLINQAFHRINILKLTQNDKLCLSLSSGFVTMPLQFLSALIAGSSFTIFPKDVVSDPQLLMSEIDQLGINVVEVTVSGLRSFLETTSKDHLLSLNKLRTLLVAGEKLPLEIAMSFNNLYRNIELMNAYGQTECSGMTLSLPILKSNNTYRICEGYPSQNNCVYLLDEKGSLVPYGVKGEICVSGDGLAKGYVRKPKINKEKFVAHPFKKDAVLYKTGDFGRRYLDGSIEVLGRIDDLVKIRGYRVEPSEISFLLQKYANVKRAFATSIQKDSQDILVIYYTTNDNNSIEPSLLTSYLKQFLPSYMIPSYFEHLKKFPVSNNGKLDRKSLPKPKMHAHEGRLTSRIPTTEIEKEIAKVWQDILGISEIFVDDNFINLNGHSLNAVQISSRLSHKFGVKLAASAIFENPTIEKLALMITKNNEINTR